MAAEVSQAAPERQADMRWLGRFIGRHKFAAFASIIYGLVGGITLALEPYYVGVIIGEDLKYRDGEIVVDHEARASTDRSLFGIKKMFDEQPESAAAKADELIKNTYRTLMSRGMKGCYIYCCDEQLHEYLERRVATLSTASR